MISNHPVKVGDHRHCGSGDMTFLVVEVQNSPCSCLNPPLLFVHVNKSDIGYTSLE